MPVPYARSILGRLFPSRRMQQDWDRRAREDALHYIDCGHGGSEETFWRSGVEDLENYILRDLEIDPGASTLEIGCGIGRLLRPLSERAASAIGVDISGEMIRRGREAHADRPNARLQRTDGDLAGIPTASLDLVYSHIVFQHIPSKKAISRYLAESARVLKGSGIFRFQVDGRPGEARLPDTWNGVRYRGPEIRAELEGLGFVVADLTGENTQYMWVTARRSSPADRPVTSSVRSRPRVWNLAALDRLLERLGPGPADRDRVVSGGVSLRELAGPLMAKHRSLPPAEYVTAMYRALLGREPDEGGLTYYAGEIEQGIGRSNVVDCLLASAEFDALLRAESPR